MGSEQSADTSKSQPGLKTLASFRALGSGYLGSERKGSVTEDEIVSLLKAMKYPKGLRDLKNRVQELVDTDQNNDGLWSEKEVEKWWQKQKFTSDEASSLFNAIMEASLNINTLDNIKDIIVDDWERELGDFAQQRGKDSKHKRSATVARTQGTIGLCSDAYIHKLFENRRRQAKSMKQAEEGSSSSENLDAVGDQAVCGSPKLATQDKKGLQAFGVGTEVQGPEKSALNNDGDLANETLRRRKSRAIRNASRRMQHHLSGNYPMPIGERGQGYDPDFKTAEEAKANLFCDPDSEMASHPRQRTGTARRRRRSRIFLNNPFLIVQFRNRVALMLDHLLVEDGCTSPQTTSSSKIEEGKGSAEAIQTPKATTLTSPDSSVAKTNRSPRADFPSPPGSETSNEMSRALSGVSPLSRNSVTCSGSGGYAFRLDDDLRQLSSESRGANFSRMQTKLLAQKVRESFERKKSSLKARSSSSSVSEARVSADLGNAGDGEKNPVTSAKDAGEDSKESKGTDVVEREEKGRRSSTPSEPPVLERSYTEEAKKILAEVFVMEYVTMAFEKNRYKKMVDRGIITAHEYRTKSNQIGSQFQNKYAKALVEVKNELMATGTYNREKASFAKLPTADSSDFESESETTSTCH